MYFQHNDDANDHLTINAGLQTANQEPYINIITRNVLVNDNAKSPIECHSHQSDTQTPYELNVSYDSDKVHYLHSEQVYQCLVPLRQGPIITPCRHDILQEIYDGQNSTFRYKPNNPQFTVTHIRVKRHSLSGENIL